MSNLAERGVQQQLRDITPNLGPKGTVEFAAINAKPKKEKQHQLRRFAYSRDHTGVLLGDLLGVRLADSFAQRIQRDFSDPENSKGKLREQREDERNFLGMVTLVELDRMNDVHHDAGDAALIDTVKIIEEKIEESIRLRLPIGKFGKSQDITSFYDIFHLDGADFAYTLHLPIEAIGQTEPSDVVGEINKKISKAKTTTRGVEDGSLLVAHAVAHKDAISIFNQLQDYFSAGGRNEGTMDKPESLRALIYVLRKLNDSELYKQQILVKANKYVDKKIAGEEDADLYFRKYVQKRFKGTVLATTEGFGFNAETIDVPAIKEHVAQEVDRVASIKFVEEYLTSSVSHQTALTLMRKSGLTAPAFTASVVAESEKLKQQVNEQQVHVNSLELKRHAVGTEAGKKMIIFESVLEENQHTILELNTNEDLLKQPLTEEQRSTFIKLLSYRDFFPQLVEPENPTQQEKKLLRKLQRKSTLTLDNNDFTHLQRIFEVARNEFEILTYRYDAVTGLPKRVEYMLHLKDRLEKKRELTEGQKVQTVYIDLGFLQYINSAGRLVGNYALKRTAEVLEQALKETELDGHAFRIGGDEFVCLFSGTDHEMRLLIDKIQELKHQVGPIPRTEHSNPLYRPEELAINYGIADHIIAESTLQNLLVAGYEHADDSDDYIDALARVQTRIADLSSKPQKAESRLIDLIDKVKDFFPTEIPQFLNIFQRQIDFLVLSSQKAIMGTTLRELFALANDPAYDIGTTNGIRNLRSYIQRKSYSDHEIDPHPTRDVLIQLFVDLQNLNLEKMHTQMRKDKLVVQNRNDLEIEEIDLYIRDIEAKSIIATNILNEIIWGEDPN